MLSLYNTLSKRVEVFEPPVGRPIGLYVCGPTVYDHAHIGHGRAYIVYDVVCRYLRRKFTQEGVIYVRNVTDIDDKIIQRANKESLPWQQIAQTYLNSFNEDLATLGLLPPDHTPRVSDPEVMAKIQDLIAVLIEGAFAYVAQDGVYFSVDTMPDYGKLSGRKLEDLQAGARVDVDVRKHNPMDFALWKHAKEGEPAWDAPWGKGRPGWHIECSAMIALTLGHTIDIHAGGMDLIFPHHENEIAQSECAHGKPLARYWIHNGFITMDQEKMSKSLGNTLSLKDVLSRHHPEVVKLYVLTSHYRSPMEMSPVLLDDARKALDRLYRALLSVGLLGSEPYDNDMILAFERAMDDDFNTPKALAVMFEAASAIHRLCKSSQGLSQARILAATLRMLGCSILGLFQEEPESYFRHQGQALNVDVAEIESLIVSREQSRREKNFARADEIRQELLHRGIILEDAPDGTFWRLK